jgi:glycosyltransferase involved in cell wall biosynthesis
MRFSLIICGYNEEKNIDDCIKSCIGQNYPKDDFEVIYVDNNSKDKSLELAKKYPIIYLTETKQGLSEARNCGIKNAKGDILVFLDVDLVLDKNYLKHHQETFNDKGVGAGGGMVLPLIKTWVSDYLGVSLFGGYPRFNKSRFVRTYPGCNLTIRKNVIDEVGFFKEGIPTPSGVNRFAEDNEMCERIRKAGYKILYNPLPIVYHENTHSLSWLFKIWVKGSITRYNIIKSGKKDPFSLMFKYNVPALGLFTLFLIFLFSRTAFFVVLFLFIFPFLVLSVKAFIETKLFFQSFFIKPFLDIASLVAINFSIIFYSLRK